MLMTYSEITYEQSPWILDIKDFINLSSIDKIAVDAIMHDLNNGYFDEVGSDRSTFEEDAKESYWCNNNCYLGDNCRVYINNNGYILQSVHVTQNNRIIVTVVKPTELYPNNESELEEEIENLDSMYFLVEY